MTGLNASRDRKTGGYPSDIPKVIFPNFPNFKASSLQLKLSLMSTSWGTIRFFGRRCKIQNCSLLGTDNVRVQISEFIFAANGGYCLYFACKKPIFFNVEVVTNCLFQEISII